MILRYLLISVLAVLSFQLFDSKGLFFEEKALVVKELVERKEVGKHNLLILVILKNYFVEGVLLREGVLIEVFSDLKRYFFQFVNSFIVYKWFTVTARECHPLAATALIGIDSRDFT